MNQRHPPAPQHRALKTLFRALVERCGGFDAAATVVRVGRSQLHAYCDMGCDQFAPVDVVADLERIAGEPLLTRELALRAGQELRPVEASPGRKLGEAFARLAAESAECFSTYAEAISDGQVCNDERSRIASEAGDVIASAQAIIAATKVHG